ncbi:MAG: N-acetyltransferase [bacterium]
MSLKVVEAEKGKVFKDFINLPWTLYRGDPYWVPPLKKDVSGLLSIKHPFYRNAQRKIFVCYKNERPAGRIVGILNNAHNEIHNEKTGFFGFFESIPDQEVASALFAEAESYLVENGMEVSRGPVNPSMNEECGLLVDNFMSPPFIMTPYNPPYYSDLIEGAGYSKAKDLFAYYFNVGQRLPDRLARLAKKIEQREKGLTVRYLDMKNFDHDLELVKTIYNEAWEKNWGFFPMTDEEINYMAKNLKPIVDPEKIAFAFIDGEPAGFLMALPDYNQVLRILNGRLLTLRLIRALKAAKEIKTARVMILGTREKFRKRGIEALLFALLWQKGIDRGEKYGEFSWTLEDNTLVNETAMKIFGATRYKTYRIYDRELRNS